MRELQAILLHDERIVLNIRFSSEADLMKKVNLSPAWIETDLRRCAVKVRFEGMDEVDLILATVLEREIEMHLKSWRPTIGN